MGDTVPGGGGKAPGGSGTGTGARWAIWLGLYIVVAFALKATTFGDLNRHADETFYFLVGQRMHDGLLPYVDMWDRKPWGLFAIYYLIAGISTSVLAYQFTACLFAAATATVIGRIVGIWTGWKGALCAGLAYLFAIGPFEGSTGQAPDFYNLFIAGAGLLVVQSLETLRRGQTGWRVWAAMALCGVAITIKQTSLFESLFFGLVVLHGLYRGGRGWRGILGVALACAAIGALPTLAIAGYYWQAGHWHEFWHAMVTSNLAKTGEDGGAWRLLVICLRAGVLLLCALGGLLLPGTDRQARAFVAGWLIAGVVGFLSVPNFYPHYTLPLMVPLSVAAGLLLGQVRMRLVLMLAVALWSMLWHKPLRGEATRESIASMQAIAKVIRQRDSGGGLLVYEAPHYLYALTGKPFLSPLVFPHHLNHAIETNVSHLDTRAEIDRILANRPGVIALSRRPRSHPFNAHGRSRVLAYAKANCRSLDVVDLREDGASIPIVIFGACRATGQQGA